MTPNANPVRSGSAGARVSTVVSLIIAVVAAAVLGAWLVLGRAGQNISAIEVVTATIHTEHAAGSGSVVLEATGYVVARRQAAVSSKITGKVAAVLIEEGMLVEEDQLLARLDDLIPRAEYDLALAQLENARLGVRELTVMLAQAQRDLDRTDTLAQRGHVSRALLEQKAAEANALEAQVVRARQAIAVAERNAALKQQVLADTEIRSPFSGIVTTKSAQPGEMISPVSAGGGFTRTGIGTIVDMDSLEVQVDVNEALIDRVFENQPANVVLNAYALQRFPAAVTAIIPAADRNKATIRIRIGLLERDPRILPGMGVRVSFSETPQPHSSHAPQRVLVPASAVADDVAGRFVYVATDGVARRREVTTSDAGGRFLQVRSGLTEGDQVIVDMSDALEARLWDGAPIKIRH